MIPMIERMFPSPISQQKAYNLGHDCGEHGANMENSHYSIFSSIENTREWERGKRDGETSRKKSE